eukprot:9150643-Ditylum_brightwellii.AAC.1
MKESGMQVSVQANTALLKGYAHSGQMAKGFELYASMCHSKERRKKPNVRTLNTLLRGCLWTAAAQSDSIVAGGIITGEEAWCMSVQQQKQKSAVMMQPDSSSYEYSITLLCQALWYEEAEKRIAQMKDALNNPTMNAYHQNDHHKNADNDEDNQNDTESVAVALASLARAYALLGKRKEASKNAQGALNAIDAMIISGKQHNKVDDVDSNNGKSRGAIAKGGEIF